MLDPTVSLATFSHAGGGHAPTRSLTPDGQRVVAWAKTLPEEQRAAVVKAFATLGLQVNDLMSNEVFNSFQGGGAPARYDAHTGTFYPYGQTSDNGEVICADPSLLVAKRHR